MEKTLNTENNISAVNKYESDELKDKIDFHTNELASNIQNMISEFENKTNTRIIIDFEINKPIVVSLLVDEEKSLL